MGLNEKFSGPGVNPGGMVAGQGDTCVKLPGIFIVRELPKRVYIFSSLFSPVMMTSIDNVLQIIQEHTPENGSENFRKNISRHKRGQELTVKLQWNPA